MPMSRSVITNRRLQPVGQVERPGRVLEALVRVLGQSSSAGITCDA